MSNNYNTLCHASKYIPSVLLPHCRPTFYLNTSDQSPHGMHIHWSNHSYEYTIWARFGPSDSHLIVSDECSGRTLASVDLRLPYAEMVEMDTIVLSVSATSLFRGFKSKVVKPIFLRLLHNDAWLVAIGLYFMYALLVWDAAVICFRIASRRRKVVLKLQLIEHVLFEDAPMGSSNKELVI